MSFYRRNPMVSAVVAVLLLSLLVLGDCNWNPYEGTEEQE